MSTVLEMALMGFGAFNFDKIYFTLITYLKECRKELTKITTKSFFKKNKTITKDRYFRYQTSP